MKKIIALCLVVILAATAVIGGTLAYFTDTDKADNVFTLGGVKIQLNELERGTTAEGKVLAPFTQNKILMPIAGSVQDAPEEEVGGIAGLPVIDNYVDKILTVTNIGKSEAYMKVFIAIPEELDNVADAGKNILHGNTTLASNANWTNEKLEHKHVEISGVYYNVYSRICKDKIAPNATTATPAYIGWYLDKGFDYNNDTQKYTINGEDIDFDFSKGVTIPVFAQGIQVDGFESAEDAFAKSGLPTNPWAK